MSCFFFKEVSTMRIMSSAFAVALAMGGATSASGQQAQPQAQLPPPLEVGAVAPDFAITGATRHGVLRDPVRLSDYKGKTVVLAFFFRARTRG
jgi:hypothetical protein